MKKALLAVIAVSTIAVFSQTAFAQNDKYVSINFAPLTFDFSITADESFSTPAIVARVGSQIQENLSIEGRFAIGVGDDSKDGYSFTDPSFGRFDFSLATEIETLLGLYLRTGLSIEEKFSPYGVFGFTNVRTKLTATTTNLPANVSVPISDTETSTSFGVGADIELDGDRGMNVEYMNYYDKDGNTISGISVGYIHRFW